MFEYEGLTHSDCGSACLHESPLSGKIRSWQYFQYKVPADGLLEISISGGNGDADLYTRNGADPTLSTYACRPFLNGNNETCSTQAKKDDVWHIGIYAYRRYNGVDLRAEVKAVTAGNGAGPGGNSKTGIYYYGTDFGNLDVIDDGGTCSMNNADVKTVDLNHGTSGSTAFEFLCPVNTWKEINGAYSPLNDAHYFGGVVFDMYQAYLAASPLTFQLTMRVHYSTNYENAFWNGSSMTFGDGRTTFYPLVSLDVSAHEVGHGFTEQNSDLIYSGESGGINESFSDIAGEAAEFFMRNSNDFLVGWEIFKSTNGALRYMCNPPQDGRSIDDVADYYAGLDVHYSSGVFNKAFCLLAKTAGWDAELAFKAFARANQMYWTPSTNFSQGAQGVVDAAVGLGLVPLDVANAFAGVGVTGLILPGGNAPPTADFSSSVSGLTVDFTDGSTDSDGNVASWNWNFGYGNSSTAQSPSHTYVTASAQTYSVTLTVTDNEGATDSVSKDVTVAPPSTSNIVLDATIFIRGGKQWVRLTWTGAVGADVEIYRNDGLIKTTPNDGDHKERPGPGLHEYQVCELGKASCSIAVTVNIL